MLAIIRALCEKVRGGAAIIVDSTLEMRGRTAMGGEAGAADTAEGPGWRLSAADNFEEQLGKYLWLSRANVSRQLGQLKLANMIKISGTEITILDEKGLRNAIRPSCKDEKVACKNSGRAAVLASCLPHRKRASTASGAGLARSELDQSGRPPCAVRHRRRFFSRGVHQRRQWGDAAICAEAEFREDPSTRRTKGPAHSRRDRSPVADTVRFHLAATSAA